MVTKEQMQEVLGDIKVSIKSSPVAPGQMEDHYMPKSPLYLVKEGESAPEGAKEILLNDKPEIAAREL